MKDYNEPWKVIEYQSDYLQVLDKYNNPIITWLNLSENKDLLERIVKCINFCNKMPDILFERESYIKQHEQYFNTHQPNQNNW